MIILGAALLIALVALIVVTLNRDSDRSPVSPIQTQEQSQETSAALETTGTTEPVMSAEDFLQYPELAERGSYSVDASAAAEGMDQVVATAGDYSLDNALLQVFYWTQVNDFLDQAGYYAYYMYGIDSTQPLDTQTISGTSLSWEQYFLDGGLSWWYQCALINTLAAEAEFALEPDMLLLLENMLVQLEAEALGNSYENADALVADGIGPGCTAQSYYDYLLFYLTAQSYYAHMVELFQPTDDQIRQYYEENLADFEAAGVTEESAPYVDVRHILIMPEDGADTEEAWAAALAKAQEILDGWKAGDATEEAFAELANAHSEDGGSNTTGGLYEDVTNDGTYVTEFESWAVDGARTVGDTGIIQTTYGYHIMYCSAINQAWYVNAQYAMISAHCSEQIEACQERCPLSFDQAAMLLTRLPETAAE